MHPEHIGPFRLEDQLGAGGMGEVYRAYDQRLQRWVAIKLIHAAKVDDRRARERLRREARAAAGLSHPSIVQIFDILEQAEGDCIVMELVHGRPLSYLLRRGPLDLGRALSWAVQIADGLQEAHSHGVVHRDLKADNVMVTAADRIKILDFGLAKRVGGDGPPQPALTADGAVIGTYYAMSPEQARGVALDHRSDLFSLGILLYEMTTAVSPFRGTNMLETLTRVCSHRQTPVSDLNPSVPEPLAALIDRLLRKDPRERPQRAAEVADTLRQIAEQGTRPPWEEHTTALTVEQRARPRRGVRIFVSTAGDVAEERALAEQVLGRLHREMTGRGGLEVVYWDHEPALIAEDQGAAPAFEPAEADIVVAVLWGREGMRLTPQGRAAGAASGTAHEIASAQRAFHERGGPQLLVYRKMARPRVLLADESAVMARLEQKKALDARVGTLLQGEGTGTWMLAYHRYMTLAEIEQLLEQHLRPMVDRVLPAAVTLSDTTGWPITVQPGSPYRGLEVFDFEHAGIFYGRTRAIAEILDALRAQAAAGRAFVLVLGMSGGGKSSVVRAGVLPLLSRPGVIEGVGLWRRAVLHPSGTSGDLVDALASALLRAEAVPELQESGMDHEHLAQVMRASPSTLPVLIGAALDRAADMMARSGHLREPPAARLVLVIDQLEEIFTRETVTPAMRDAFAELLDALARSRRVWVIATLRSDFYPRCAEIEALVALKAGDGQYELLPPSPAEIHQMIIRPARSAGLRMEKDPVTAEPLDEVLRDAAASHPASLPLLEFALEELYKRRTDDGVLTHRAYRRLGGLEGALAQRADEIFEALPAAVQEALPEVLRHLVAVGSAGEMGATRKRAPLERVTANTEARALVDAFVAARLFVTELADDGSAVVSVAHEALLRYWPRIQSWLEADREALRSLARVVAAAALWEQEGRSADFLLHDGKPLLEAQDLLSHRRGELSAAEQAFVAASVARVRRRRNLMRGLMALLTVLALAASIFATVATQQRRLAEANARLAASRQLAAEALPRLDGQLDLALLLGLESYRQAPIFEARSSLLAALGASPRLERFLHGHREQVRQVSFAPDGARLASISEQGDILLWDLETGRPSARLGEPLTRAYRVAWSPDGTLLASTAEAGVALWQVATGSRRGPLLESAAQRDRVTTLAWSPDGRHLASASRDGVVALFAWAAGTEVAVIEPIGGRAFVRCLGFSPDGRLLIWGRDDGRVTAWDTVRRQPVWSRQLHSDHVRALAFGPGGTTLATASYDHTVGLWDAASGTARRPPLTGHRDSVLTVAFRADGLLASGGVDRRVLLWDLSRERPLAVPLIGHDAPVYSLAFGAGGDTLVSAGDDRRLLVWDLSTPLPLGDWAGHGKWVFTVAFSRDDRLLASSGDDRRILLWDIDGDAAGRPPVELAAVRAWELRFAPAGNRLAAGTDHGTLLIDLAGGGEVGPLRGGPGAVRSVDFSPDGSLLAAATDQGAIDLWALDVEPPRLDSLRLAGTKGWALAFSPDGSELAVGRDDGTVALWNRARRTVERSLEGHANAVWALAYSDDGRLLATGSSDQTIRLWDAARGTPIGDPLVGHGGPVQSVAFAPGGRILASGSDDRLILLWDVESGEPLAQIDDHGGSVWSVAFSHDGQRLASGSFDHTVRLRELGDFGAWDARACRRANRNLTVAEWARFLGDQPYRATCPALPLAPDLESP